MRSAALGLLAALLCVAGLAAPAQADRAPAARKKDAVAAVRLVKPTVSGDRATFTAKWQRTPRARSYRVRLTTMPRTTRPSAQTTRARSVVLRNLRQGTTYCLQVRARFAGRKGPWSPVVCRTTPEVARVGAPWVSGQQLQGTPVRSVAVTFSWPPVAGATSYQLDYAPGTGDVQRSRKRKTVRAGASASVTVGRLTPGATYCFQVRAVSKWGPGLRSTTACRIVTPADRPLPLRAAALDVATWNVCSTICKKPSWASRRTAVRDRMLAMDADVIGVQEAIDATPYLDQSLPGYTRGCRVGDGTGLGERTAGRQSLYVRTGDAAAYRVVPGTNHGIVFGKVGTIDPTHGACWVELESLATGRRVIVASVHLVQPIGKVYDKGRDRQTQQLLTAIGARYPAGTLPPVVLSGDFNSHRQRAYDGPRVRLEANGYRDSFDVAARFLTPTYRNSAHGWSTTPVTSVRWGNHLDHVFTSAGVHVASWRIDEPLTADGLRYERLLSDHSPVVVSLRIPLPATPPDPE